MIEFTDEQMDSLRRDLRKHKKEQLVEYIMQINENWRVSANQVERALKLAETASENFHKAHEANEVYKSVLDNILLPENRLN